MLENDLLIFASLDVFFCLPESPNFPAFFSVLTRIKDNLSLEPDLFCFISIFIFVLKIGSRINQRKRLSSMRKVAPMRHLMKKTICFGV